MIPVSPVIPNAEASEVVVAEHQPEYQNLPSILLEGGVILCRWKLDEREREIVASTGDIYLFQWRGQNPVTPMFLQVEVPEIVGAPPYQDEVLESETIETDTLCDALAAASKPKPKYRISCSFDAEPFEWGMEDGVFHEIQVIPRWRDASTPESRSAMYPGYLKEDEPHFAGGGIKHSKFQPYIETHKGRVAVDEDCWIVTNPGGEKEVYPAEDFHQIYSLETGALNI